jgi:hypothetical protein
MWRDMKAEGGSNEILPGWSTMVAINPITPLEHIAPCARARADRIAKQAVPRRAWATDVPVEEAT